MDKYLGLSYDFSRQFTQQYSTSFSLSSTLFNRKIRPAIYAVYGMVRVADEIVDTYQGIDASALLDSFEREVLEAIDSPGNYSTNPLVRAFADTASQYAIGRELVEPFFASMRMDVNQTALSQKEYEAYIYGSAEVIGLMCLRVFVGGNEGDYERLREGAQALGSAYQKVNFLRDIKADYAELGRSYFPGVTMPLSEADKHAITHDIAQDFDIAKQTIAQLPASARKAVRLSYLYYSTLLRKLEKESAEGVQSHRIRVSNIYKLWLYILVRIGVK